MKIKTRHVISINRRKHAKLLRWLMNEKGEFDSVNNAILMKLYGLMYKDKSFINNEKPRK